MKKVILVLLIFLLLTAIMTFPLIFKMNTVIPGTFDTTETFAWLWQGWLFKFSFDNKIDLNNFQFISYPFVLSHVNAVAFPVGIFMIRLVSILTNEVFMCNFLILLSFLLSGLFAFFLVRYLTKNTYAAFFAGIIYAFCPFHFIRSWQHLGLAEIQWMPLYLYALVKLRDTIKLQNALLVALAFFLLYENYTYAYFVAVATIVFALFIFFFKGEQKQKKRVFKLLGISLFFTFLLTLPSVYIIYKNLIFGPPQEARGLYYRSFSDLFAQSARPLSYFLPSAFHPILGKLTQMFIGSGFYGNSFTEHTLYLGWVPLVLAFVAFRGRIKNKQTLKPDESFYLGFFIILAIVAWFFSQPPWWRWGPVRIYMPSFFMYKILPMFRAYCRFGIIVMLAISVLAGFGLNFVLNRFKSQRTKSAMTFLFCGLVLFEFWNYPPFRVIDLTKYPSVYDWLREQPSQIVIAEYPLDLNGANELYKFYQTKHHKRMINATAVGTYANRVSQALKDISVYKAAEGLRWMGVDYVLVHRDSYENNENLQEKLGFENIAENKGLKLIRIFDKIMVYKIVAQPNRPDIK